MSEYEALRIVLELARKSPISNDAEKNKKEQEAIDIVCDIAERNEYKQYGDSKAESKT